MKAIPFEAELRTLAEQAWDREVTLDDIVRWMENFNGGCLSQEDEEKYALHLLTRFMFFSRRLIREMLRSLYRDLFEAPLKQKIRRRLRNSSDTAAIENLYQQELRTTRFIGVGNPSESGAHLLYYFRQVNRLPKYLFVDCASAFRPISPEKGIARFVPRDSAVTRFVFFDDLVGSGDQASRYLSRYLKGIRLADSSVELMFRALFATSEGLQRLNENGLFDSNAECLFELDESYKAFGKSPRYFVGAPSWMNPITMQRFVTHYGNRLTRTTPLGYGDGQLLLAFSHNTPDNSLPIFWNEGRGSQHWTPLFLRYDKVYVS